jgi:hypothetical protein
VRGAHGPAWRRPGGQRGIAFLPVDPSKIHRASRCRLTSSHHGSRCAEALHPEGVIDEATHHDRITVGRAMTASLVDHEDMDDGRY